MHNKLQIYLEFPRLILRSINEADDQKMQDFDQQNQQYLSPWRPTIAESIIDYKAQLLNWEQEFKEEKSIRLLLFLKGFTNGDIVGGCHFSQIFRGPFQACYLGYHMGENYAGKGFMTKSINARNCLYV